MSNLSTATYLNRVPGNGQQPEPETPPEPPTPKLSEPQASGILIVEPPKNWNPSGRKDAPFVYISTLNYDAAANATLELNQRQIDNGMKGRHWYCLTKGRKYHMVLRMLVPRDWTPLEPWAMPPGVEWYERAFKFQCRFNQRPWSRRKHEPITSWAVRIIDPHFEPDPNSCSYADPKVSAVVQYEILEPWKPTGPVSMPPMKASGLPREIAASIVLTMNQQCIDNQNGRWHVLVRGNMKGWWGVAAVDLYGATMPESPNDLPMHVDGRDMTKREASELVRDKNQKIRKVSICPRRWHVVIAPPIMEGGAA